MKSVLRDGDLQRGRSPLGETVAGLFSTDYKRKTKSVSVALTSRNLRSSESAE